MVCLGIESTAHTFGVAILTDKGKVLSNEKDGFTTTSGGMIPFQVFEHHVEFCDKVIVEALKKAKKTTKDIKLIAYSQGPGMGQCLRVGAFVARFLASKLSIPIVGVDHCIAHLEIGNHLTKAKDPVMLYVSGANTQVIAYEGGRYRLFGETLDQGIGNFLDSFARYVGLGFPGGPKISALAEKGKKLIELPYPIKGMDMGFGGLLTNVKQKYDSKKYSLEDLCYSIQETVFAMMVEVSERAMAHCEKDELLLAGGVACNTRLVEMCKTMCKERKAKMFVPERQYLLDNAAMIAWLGIITYKHKKKSPILKATINPYERTDEIQVIWRK